MSKLPLVSVVVPAFNAGRLIAGCLQSVVQQDYQPLEVIVVDGASRDETRDVMAEFMAKHPHIRFVSEPDKGVYDAINKGIRLAQGEWLYVLGCDDRLAHPHALSELAPLLESDAELVHAKVLRKSTGLTEGRTDVGSEIVLRNICQQAILYRRTLFQRLGDFNLKYPICADWDFNIRCFALPSRVAHSDTLLCHYDGGGLSSRVTDEVFYADRLAIALHAYRLPLTHARFRPLRYMFHDQAQLYRRQGAPIKALRFQLSHLYHAVCARWEAFGR